MKKILGLLLLLVGVTMVIGAGATFRYYEADRSITVNITSDDNELIDLDPIQPYAYLNDGKLTIEISPNNPNYPGYGDGMSHNTTYVFEEMFNVSNDLWENNESDFPICVTIHVTGNGVVEVFAGNYNDNGTATIANPDTSITFTVYHNSPVPVGFIFNNTCLDQGMHSVQMSINAEAGACT